MLNHKSTRVNSLEVMEQIIELSLIDETALCKVLELERCGSPRTASSPWP